MALSALECQARHLVCNFLTGDLHREKSMNEMSKYMSAGSLSVTRPSIHVNPFPANCT